jgi:exodeoxyribonuclease VII large subunit
MMIEHYDVLVQGEHAPGQIAQAIAQANALSQLPDVLVLTRGGGSADDLAAWSTEQVTRAVAASRIPTLVAIGHEVDVSLSELAADAHASTPSNAAEILTPDRTVVLQQLELERANLSRHLLQMVSRRIEWLAQQHTALNRGLEASYVSAHFRLQAMRRLIEAYSPTAALQRGYAVIHDGAKIITRVGELRSDMVVQIELSDGTVEATIKTKEKQ